MSCRLPDLTDADAALMQCILVASRRGAQIRAELRIQYGEAEGDKRMSELAREAETRLWPTAEDAPEERGKSVGTLSEK